MRKFVKISAIVAAICLVLLIGAPSNARADFVVNLGDSVTQAQLSLDITAGTFSYQGSALTFTVNGELISLPDSGQQNSTGSFTTNGTSLSFSSSDFGMYNVSNLNVSLTLGGGVSTYNTQVTVASLDGSVQNPTFTIGMSNSQAENVADPHFALTSTLSSSDIPSGTVTFKSTVASLPDKTVTSDTGYVSLSGPLSTLTSTSATVYGDDPSNPFQISNTLFTLSDLGTTADTVQATTTLTSLPEPASWMLALSGAPALTLGWWLRRRVRASAA